MLSSPIEFILLSNLMKMAILVDAFNVSIIDLEMISEGDPLKEKDKEVSYRFYLLLVLVISCS